MKRLISFGSIEQLRSAVFNLNKQVKHESNTTKMPTMDVVFSEKIHGSNAAVCYCNEYGLWAQSRKNIITPGQDNAGCAMAVEERHVPWEMLIMKLSLAHDINLSTHIISVFYEWAGGNIQSKSALTGLEKRATIFQHFKVSPIDPESEEAARWVETSASGQWVSDTANDIYNLMDFTTWEIEVDFENYKLHQNDMISIVNTVEARSPVGEHFAKQNIGEGIVGTFFFEDVLYRFKVKGEKHSATKVKVLKPVDEALEQKKVDFVNTHACTAARLEQAWQTVFGIENEIAEPDIRFTGDFLRCVVNDVMKEESDLAADQGLSQKELNPMISKSARNWFMEQLENTV